MTRRLVSRRGLGLLLVLAVLAVGVSAAAGAARIAWHVRNDTTLSADEALAADLLVAAEAPIRDWLARRSALVVLPPDAGSPRVGVVGVSLIVGERECRVEATAFDQCGLVPLSATLGALRSALPADVLRMASAVGSAASGAPGLDLFATVTTGSRRTFPVTGASDLSAVGELIATHNPHREGARPTLNVNTAPMPLVQAVYDGRQLAGVEQIVTARQAGKAASPGSRTQPPSSGVADDAFPVPVAASTAWAIRLDVEAGRIRRSWWCVYVDRGGSWELVQRLAIDE